MRRNKVLQINDEGALKELATFLHPYQRGEQQHFYFNTNFSKMIELTIVDTGNKIDGHKGTYREYSNKSGGVEKTWVLTKELNDASNNDQFIEWHHKTLYPYPLNQDDLSVVVWNDKETEEAKE